MIVSPTHPAGPPVRSPVIASVVTLGLFFGGFGGWAALAPLSSAAIAPGTVAAQGHRRTVQHKEGGIIAELLVRDGDRVEAGQVLVRLDVTQAAARVAKLTQERAGRLAVEVRLIAMQQRAEHVRYPAEPSLGPALIRTQDEIFRAAREAFAGQRAMLDNRIAQNRARIDGATARLASLNEQIGSLSEEIAALLPLVERKNVARPRLSELERRRIELAGRAGETRADLTEAETAIAESRSRLVTLTEQIAQETATELAETQHRLAEIEQELAASKDILARSEITAPTAGTVVNARFFTEGGVIAPGAPILDLQPRDERLIVRARIDPLDVDVVREGQHADVALTAYSARSTPRLPARLAAISADVLVTEDGQGAYFDAMIELDADALAQHPRIAVHPGMPVQVVIVTGERTLLDYLLEPLTGSLRVAFRKA